MLLNKKKIILIILVSLFCFFIDRISKIYFINFFLQNSFKDYYFNPYLNFILIWNKGIAFGLFDYENFVYHFISLIIFVIIIFLLFISYNSKTLFETISYSIIFGGAFGNFFDRIYYQAVPDFIDLHYKGYHWFTFNVSDILITIGIVLILIFDIFKIKINR